MTILGKITVKLSDDTRYVAGSTYDIVLETSQTPDPAQIVTGTMAPVEDPTSPPASTTAG